MHFDFTTLPFYLLNAHEGGPTGMQNLFNFVLAFGIIAFLFKKFNVFGAIDTQHGKIAREIEAAEAQKKKALEQLQAVKKRTENLTQEVDDILKTAKASAENLSAQIIESARDEASKIIDASHKRVELEQRSAMKALEARLLNDALQQVRETLTESLTHEDQERSVDDFLEELSRVKVEA